MMIRRMLRQILVVSAGASVLAGCTIYEGYPNNDAYYDYEADQWYVIASIDGRSCYPVAYDPYYDASYFALMGYGWSPVDCGPYYRYSRNVPANVSYYYGYNYGPYSPFWYSYSPGYYYSHYYGYNAGYGYGYGPGYGSGYYYEPYWGYYPWGSHNNNKKKTKPVLTTADGRRERISPEVDFDETIRHRIGVAPNWPSPTRSFGTGPNGSGSANAGTGWASDAPAVSGEDEAPTGEASRRRRDAREPRFRPPSHASAPRSGTVPTGSRATARPTSGSTSGLTPRPVVSQPSAPQVSQRPTVTRAAPRVTTRASAPRSAPAPRTTSTPSTKSSPAPSSKSSGSRPSRK